MTLRRSLFKPMEGKDIPISILEICRQEEMLWIAKERSLEDAFPPCIKNIMQRAGDEKGKHRAGAILASFLGQAGWSEPEARMLWSHTASIDEKIFSKWFGKMHCPKCATIKRQSKGYPDLGAAELGICLPDERCTKFEGPVEYACRLQSEEDRYKGTLWPIKTYYLIRVFDWSRGREGEIELSESEYKDLENVLKDPSEKEDKMLVCTGAKVRGRLRPKFSLHDRKGPRRQMLSDIL
jgi:hypothetical protein